MCGIVGYIGRRDAIPVLLEGLRSLEYRGYDSAGLAVIHRNRLQVTKTAGRVQDLRDRVSDRTRATIGIGHTRWATHGEPNDVNAHPHTDAEGRIAVVHNGIIENAEQLRDALSARGVKLVSDTDTEALAHLIAAEATTTAPAWRTRSAARCATWRARTAWWCWTSSTRTNWWWRATAARSCSASASPRCSSPPTWPRWCATPSRSCTWTTPRSPRCTPPTTSRRRSTSGTGAARAPARCRPRWRPRPATTSSARTRTSCARRSTSSRRRCAGRCAAGSTTGSPPRSWAGSTWTRASSGRSGR